MKTAMQELKEIIEEHRDNYKGKETLRVKKAFGDILCAIDDFKLLEKEKQQIIDAVNSQRQLGWEEKGEQYYNETFGEL